MENTFQNYNGNLTTLPYHQFFSISRRRTLLTISKIEKQTGSQAIFDGIIRDELDKAYIEFDPEEEINLPSAYYNPLFGEIKFIKH